MDPTSPGTDRSGELHVGPATEPATPAADAASTAPLPAATPPTREPGTDMTQPSDVPPAAAVPTAGAPTDVPPAGAAPAAASPTATPARPSGPNAPAILLGLACLAVAVLAILHETTSLVVNWSALGPGAVIAAGVLLLVVGVVGLARRER